MNTFFLIKIRIERLWRDVHSKVTRFYAELFKTLEREGFDISNQTHLFILQYLFLPRIQDDLNQFIRIWNRHKLSTERNRSPLQLMATRIDKFPFLEELENVDMFGVEDDIDIEEGENELPAVECEKILCPLSDANFLDFKLRISPLTLETPVEDLILWFYTALEIVANYENN